MAVSNAQFKPVVKSGAKNTEITNLVLTTSGVEQSLVLNNNLRGIIIRSRDLSTLQLAFVSGESSTKYLTIKPRAVLSLEDLEFATSTLYIQADSDNTIVEILELYS